MTGETNRVLLLEMMSKNGPGSAIMVVSFASMLAISWACLIVSGGSAGKVFRTFALMVDIR